MPELFLQVEANRTWIVMSVLMLLLLWETIHPFFGFFGRDFKSRSLHGLVNMGIWAINALVVGLIFTALWLSAGNFAAEQNFGLLNWLDLPVLAETLIAILLFDIWTYWWHRMCHVVPFLWRFHRVHHSDTKMDVTTASRFHLGEITISSLLRIPLIILFGAQLWQLALYEVLMFPLVQLQHANVKLPNYLDRFIRVFFTSPDMHKVHHSDQVVETNSNYTSMFSVWDRLFGSFRLRKDPENIRIGLEEFRSAREQSFGSLFTNPVNQLSPTSKDIPTKPPPE